MAVQLRILSDKDFTKPALSVGPKDAEARAEYTSVLNTARTSKDDAKVEAALKRAVELQPKSAEPHYLLAVRVSDPAKRIEAFHIEIDDNKFEMFLGGERQGLLRIFGHRNVMAARQGQANSAVNSRPMRR